MNTALILAALALGAGSGGHCMVMCGATSTWCAGHDAGQGAWRRLVLFQLGRVIGYACIGAILASAASGLQVLSSWIGALRPLWTMANVALLVVGLYLLASGRQPLLLATFGERFGVWVRARLQPATTAQPVFFHAYAGAPAATVTPAAPSRATGHARSLLVGMSWAVLPCGPLYSAWALALFAGSAAGGALTAASFAVASGVQLMLAQRFLLRRRGAQTDGAAQEDGAWGRTGVRLAGLALSVSAAWSILTLMFPAYAEWLCL